MLRTALVVGLLATLASGQQFVRDLSFSAPNTWTNGIAIADLDADGDHDIVFANGSSYGGGGSEPQRLRTNDGTGTFAQSNLPITSFNAQMVIAVDVDNDGDLDLPFAPEGPFPNTNQRARILINRGGIQGGVIGTFADDSNARMPATTMASFCVAAGDLDNDGDLDLVYTDGATFFGQATQALFFENDGNGFFTDTTAAHFPADTYNAQDVTLFDYDGDFDIDVALSGKGAAGKRSRLWLNDGAGNFTVATGLDLVGTGNTYEIDWADLDGDSDWDASVQSLSFINEGWSRNDGTPNTAQAEIIYSGGNGQDDNEMAQLDYDDDGDLDAFVGSLGNTEKAYNYDGTSFVRDAGLVQAINDSTLDIGFGDLDGDGRHDLVSAQGESGNFTNKIYLNNGPVDTLPPTFLNVEFPAIAAGTTQFRAHIQDAIVDDGLTNATMSFAYETFIAGAPEATGFGDAFHMGGGLFSAEVPTSAATDGIRLTWTATDDVSTTGNSSTFVVEVGIAGSAWVDLGLGKPGTGGIVPVLTGSGPLTPGSANAVATSDALPNTTLALFVGLTDINAPFKGGVLVPSPDILVVGLPTDASGTFTLPFTWPNGIPAGTLLYWQEWITDPGASQDLSATNGLESTAN